MQEIDYLFSEMLQERSKLKSWSCTIAGTKHGQSIEMKLLVNEEKVRFTRKRHIPEQDAELVRGADEKGKLIKTGEIVHIPEHDYVEHTCDNGLMTASWHVDVFNQQCNIYKSSPSLRQGNRTKIVKLRPVA